MVKTKLDADNNDEKSPEITLPEIPPRNSKSLSQDSQNLDIDTLNSTTIYEEPPQEERKEWLKSLIKFAVYNEIKLKFLRFIINFILTNEIECTTKRIYRILRRTRHEGIPDLRAFAFEKLRKLKKQKLIDWNVKYDKKMNRKYCVITYRNEILLDLLLEKIDSKLIQIKTEEKNNKIKR